MTTQSLLSTATNHTYINQLSKHVGQEVVLKGWLYNMRSSGKIAFPQLRDGTGIVQCVVLKNAIDPETWEALKGLGQETGAHSKDSDRFRCRRHPGPLQPARGVYSRRASTPLGGFDIGEASDAQPASRRTA